MYWGGFVMKSWQRAALTLMIGSFPAAVFLLNSVSSRSPSRSEPQTVSTPEKSIPPEPASNAPYNFKELNNLDRGINSKVREMKEIDLEITETRGEIIRLEEKKGFVRKDLEALQARLAPIINGMDRRKPSGKSAKAEAESADNQIR
jgi:hypothetical protein